MPSEFIEIYRLFHEYPNAWGIEDFFGRWVSQREQTPDRNCCLKVSGSRQDELKVVAIAIGKAGEELTFRSVQS